MSAVSTHPAEAVLASRSASPCGPAPTPPRRSSPACLRAGEGPLAGAVTQHDAVQLGDVQLVALGPGGGGAGAQGVRGSGGHVIACLVPYLLLAGGHAHVHCTMMSGVATDQVPSTNILPQVVAGCLPRYHRG